MSAWTQIVVKGTVRDIRSQLDARQIPAYRSFHHPGVHDAMGTHQRSMALVPNEPLIEANLMHWFNEALDQPGQGPLHPGTLLWFGPYIGKVPTKSLHRVSEYAPLENYLQEFGSP